MLGERLAYLRRREGISQKELGSKLNLSHYTISSYERTAASPTTKSRRASPGTSTFPPIF